MFTDAHEWNQSGLYYKDSEGNQIETDSFIELVPDLDNRQKIKNILINEQNGNTDAKGEKCN